MEEMPGFAEMAEDYEGQDVAFLFLDYGDDADTARAAIDELGILYHKVLLDTADGEVMHLYDTTYFPTTLILDRWGGVRCGTRDMRPKTISCPLSRSCSRVTGPVGVWAGNIYSLIPSTPDMISLCFFPGAVFYPGPIVYN